jgi:hypothetical protein
MKGTQELGQNFSKVYGWGLIFTFLLAKFFVSALGDSSLKICFLATSKKKLS